MILLDGNKLSAKIRSEIAARVGEYCGNTIRPPHLAAVLVGDNPASQAYVRNKIKACEEVGFTSTLIKKDASITQSQLLELIHELNGSEDLDGYIVQLPFHATLTRRKSISRSIRPKMLTVFIRIILGGWRSG